MLIILTDQIQTGKTRWLQRLTADLQAAEIECCGVLAPGVWRKKDPSEVAEEDVGFTLPKGAMPNKADLARWERASRFEKLGIDNVLLPRGEVVPFARRGDLARAEGSYDTQSEAGKIQLGWAISDEALAQVNEHFARLAEQRGAKDAPAVKESGASDAGMQPAFLVVDELGRLELERGGGLVNATRLLAQGPSKRFPHALVVVRDWLAPVAVQLFSAAWPEIACLPPTEETRARIFELYGVNA